MYELRKVKQQDSGWWSIVVTSPGGKAIAWREWCRDEEMLDFKLKEKIKTLNGEYAAMKGKKKGGKTGWQKHKAEGTNVTFGPNGEANRQAKRSEIYKQRLRAYLEERKGANNAEDIRSV